MSASKSHQTSVQLGQTLTFGEGVFSLAELDAPAGEYLDALRAWSGEWPPRPLMVAIRLAFDRLHCPEASGTIRGTLVGIGVPAWRQPNGGGSVVAR